MLQQIQRLVALLTPSSPERVAWEAVGEAVEAPILFAQTQGLVLAERLASTGIVVPGNNTPTIVLTATLAFPPTLPPQTFLDVRAWFAGNAGGASAVRAHVSYSFNGGEQFATLAQTGNDLDAAGDTAAFMEGILRNNTGLAGKTVILRFILQSSAQDLTIESDLNTSTDAWLIASLVSAPAGFTP